jgi:hypothetical protein
LAAEVDLDSGVHGHHLAETTDDLGVVRVVGGPELEDRVVVDEAVESSIWGDRSEFWQEVEAKVQMDVSNEQVAAFENLESNILFVWDFV